MAAGRSTRANAKHYVAVPGLTEDPWHLKHNLHFVAPPEQTSSLSQTPGQEQGAQ
jgi:hypothetical protein